MPELSEPPSDLFLRSVLQRKHQPITEQFNMKVQVHGIFSAPEVWKAKMDDPTEANYSYELRVVNTHFKGAKLVAREMTEEEKAEAEAGKNKKPADAKKGKKEEDPSPEELAKWEEEKREREESNARAKSDWDALDDNTKFFRTCEDPFKEASIRFLKDVSVEDAPDPSYQENELDEAALRAFESSVCDQKGCWVYFDKIVPRDDEAAANSDPKAKKAAPKGKAPTSEEVQKPTHGRAWLNLTPLLTPGVSTLTQRIFLS
mmetsp:Transcript_6930/g.8301  ORF Transcript_6930/g.8301 Transcript_6930/m.8301 type:complete len:260 (-) Transcript_6930:2418-3197(-)